MIFSTLTKLLSFSSLSLLFALDTPASASTPQFLVSWFWNTLNYLGLSKKSARILFVGLDNAGKTTLLHMLRDDKLLLHEPTRHPQAEELVIGNIRFDAYDMGGHQAARRLWAQYLAGADGLIFLVDAVDEARYATLSHIYRDVFVHLLSTK